MIRLLPCHPQRRDGRSGFNPWRAAGLLGWFVPQVMGVGYGYVGDAPNGNMTVREALELARRNESRTWIVADRAGVVGVINLSRLEREVGESANKKVGEILNSLSFPHVHADQGLDLALERMGTNQIEMLPVVSCADVHTLEGVVTLHDVLDSYGVTR